VPGMKGASLELESVVGRASVIAAQPYASDGLGLNRELKCRRRFAQSARHPGASVQVEAWIGVRPTGAGRAEVPEEATRPLGRAGGGTGHGDRLGDSVRTAKLRAAGSEQLTATSFLALGFGPRD